MSEAVDRFAQELESRFDPNRAGGMNAVYRFVLSDEPDGEVEAYIDNGALRVAPGKSAEPDIVLAATKDDWLRILHNEVSGQMAFLTGKLKIQGDVSLAMKLQSLFQIS